MSFIKNVKRYFYYMYYAAKASLKSEVAGSKLNWIWWILEPLCFMFIYIFIFKVVFKAHEDYFPVFVLIGLAVWDFFNRMLSGSVKLISSNKQIVSKVYIPKYILLISRSFTYLFKFFISFALVIVTMIIIKVPFNLTILWVIPLTLLLYIVVFGISLIVMHFGVYVEDLANVIRIGLKLMFYATGIFYNINTSVPEPYNHILLKVNPIAFIMDSLRSVVIDGVNPNLFLCFIWLLIGIILCVLGIKLIKKYENSYVKVIL